MTKGSYTVGDKCDSDTPIQSDKSYRSFICALLIFLVICLIILLASMNWKGSYKKLSESTEPDITRKLPIQLNKTTPTTKIYNNDTKGPEITSTPTLQQTTINETTSRITNNISSFESKTVTELSSTLDESSTITNVSNEFVETALSTINVTRKPEVLLRSTTDPQQTSINETSSQSTDNISSSVTELSSTLDESSTITNVSNEFQEAVFPFTTPNPKTTTLLTTDEKVTLETISTIVNSYSGVSSEETTSQDVTHSTLQDATTTTSQTTETETSIKLSTASEIITTTVNFYTDGESALHTATPFISTNGTTFTLSPKATTVKSFLNTSNENSGNSINSIIRVLIKTKTSNNAASTNVASKILSFMNHEANPCDDFYEFACGRVYKTEEYFVDELEAYINRLDTSKKYMKYFKTFYRSCLEYNVHFNYQKRIKGIENLLKGVGMFYLNADSNSLQINDLTELVAKLTLRQSMPLFDIGVDIDKQNSKLILQLTLPHQSFLRNRLKEWSGISWHKNHCLNEQKPLMLNSFVNLTEIYKTFLDCLQGNYSIYLDSIENTIRELEDFKKLENHMRESKITEILKDIKSYVLTPLNRSAEILSKYANKSYEMKKISELQMHLPNLNWTRLFRFLTGQNVDENTPVQVYFWEYLPSMLQLLLPQDKIKNVNNVLMAIYANDLFINTVIPKEMSNRNAFCFDLAKNILPDVWSTVAAKLFPNEVSKQKKVNILFDKLKKNFCKSLDGVEWIDHESKESINLKCKNLKLSFFEAPDETKLSSTYENLTISMDYQENLIALLSNYRKTIYSNFEEPISSKLLFSYFFDPLQNKPFTSYSTEMIFVPLGVINNAQNDLPNYVMISRIGLHLARQLARHFDPIGIKYGINLSPESNNAYNHFVESMSSEMSFMNERVYQNRNISFSFDWKLSTTERIVDNTAFRLIWGLFFSFKKEKDMTFITPTYSKIKLLYIVASQSFCRSTTISDFMMEIFERKHLPPALRIENIIGNSETFINTFSCDGDCVMNRFATKLQFPFLTAVPLKKNIDDSSHFDNNNYNN